MLDGEATKMVRIKSAERRIATAVQEQKAGYDLDKIERNRYNTEKGTVPRLAP